MQVPVTAGSGRNFWRDGQGTHAHFNRPDGVAVDGNGNRIVADMLNHRIRKISPDGNVSTLTGSGGRTGATGKVRRRTSIVRVA
jgi:hypothetical protein